MTRRILVFQHMEGDGPGRFADLFGPAGTVETVELFNGHDIPALDRFDLMFVLGGAMDVWEEDAHPWLAQEKQAIREWVRDRAKPYIGICLGHQLLADALGGEVGMASTAEVGVCEIAFDPAAGEHPFFHGLKGEHKVMQWHHAEVKRLPQDARSLAASATTAVQAMAVGEHALGIQFHSEWTLDTIRGWAQVDGWIAALERHLGEGAHARVLSASAPHMPAIGRMTEALYGNFARRTGLAR